MKRFLSILYFLLVHWTAFGQQPTDKLLEFYNILNFSYVDSFDFNHLSEEAIITMLAELDPHSMYIPAEEVRRMNESLEGEYEGIGVQFDMYRDTVLVVTVIPGGPSELAGLVSGDRIISANGQVLSGLNYSDEDIIEKLRGENGSKVVLQIKRRSSDLLQTHEVIRGKIPIYAVDVSYMLDDHTGYIKINRFSKNTLAEFKQSIRELTGKGADQLVLDIRDNGGGYLMAAVELADEFIDGRREIVQTKGMRQGEQVFRSTSKGSFQEGRLIVLINEGSASASEIFAGAIQDWDRGLIMGRRSFGKGLVMKPYTFSDGSMIRLTTSKYYTPSGRCIQKDYGKDKEDYEGDVMRRFENGEMYHPDSSDIPQELIFQTTAGRTVYGGGGIYPDIFVPADSLILSAPFQDILKTSAFIEFSMDFAEKNRNRLQKFSSAEEFMANMEIGNEVRNGFMKYVMEEKILDEELGNEYDFIVKRQSMAFIARHIWDDSAYHRVMNQGQATITEALELINRSNSNWDELSIQSK